MESLLAPLGDARVFRMVEVLVEFVVLVVSLMELCFRFGTDLRFCIGGIRERMETSEKRKRKGKHGGKHGRQKTQIE